MTKIAGRYEIKAKLGEGGMGVVFRAYDPAPMDREVAVKTLHEFSDPFARELFYKECAALKSFSHPNIVEIFDMGEYEEGGHKRPFFVMPLLPGQTLDELIRKASHRLTVDRVVEIFAQTCRGLQAAHERGLIHRDLKPSNIFVMADDSVKIIDFGVAHAANEQSRSGYDKGTLLYMAPEQVQHKPVSVQSDIYSLGVTLYEALTRRQPFRNTTEDSIVQAILKQIPPPASDLNPAVSHVISRVVHKAMAKQPWNRFDSARELGDTLQKAYRNEPIALFDPARTQPRILTATKALEKGDYQFAGEIVSELEAEGNIDPQITLLRAQIDQIARQKTVAQLLESARARYEEEEDPLALQKIQEVLQLDPTNVGALGLKSKIEDRRSERQIEKWIQLAQQHSSNRSYSHAREALQNALVLRPKEPRASRLLKEIESEEQEYVRLRHEKTELYQAAVNAWQNGEVSQALSQMKLVLDLDRRAPDASSPDAAGTYQSFYNKIRSEHDAMNTGYAEARRHLADKQFDKALAICSDFLAKYPGQALFQALKFDVEEQQRQRLSAFIADTDRRLEAEADLDVKLSLVREAAAEFPDQDHFRRQAKLLQDKRDLVNSIVERARLHEGSGQITEALSDLETLRTIYAAYPGLKFEKERLQKRLEQQTRDVARAKWVRQIDSQLQAGDYARAADFLDKADVEFPDDAELAELRKLAAQGVERASRADQLVAEGQQLCEQGQFDQGVERLRSALQLDDRTGVRFTLRDLLVNRAQELFETDWREADKIVDQVLELDPNHPLARSLRARALDKRRDETVPRSASLARRLQAEGKIEEAMSEVEKGLAAYPGDSQLSVIADALQKELARITPVPPQRPSLPDERPSEAVTAARGVPAAPDAETRAVEKTEATPAPEDEEDEGRTLIIVREDVRASDSNRPARDRPSPAKARTPAAPVPPAPTPSARSGGMRWAAMAAVVIVAGAAWLWWPRSTGIGPAPTPTETPMATVAPPETSTPTPTETPAPETPTPMPDQTATPAPTPVRTPTRVQTQPLTPTPTPTPAQTQTPASPTPIPSQTPARPAEYPVRFRADRPDIQITFKKPDGTAVQTSTAPSAAPVALTEGRYPAETRGPAKIPMTVEFTVSAGRLEVPVEYVHGIDVLDPGKSRFTVDSGGWYTSRDNRLILMSRPATGGRVMFSAKVTSTRSFSNPFENGPRLTWVVGYVNENNQTICEIDANYFYIRQIVNGAQQDRVIQHNIKARKDGRLVVAIDLSGDVPRHQYKLLDDAGQTLTDWTALGQWPSDLPRVAAAKDATFGFRPSKAGALRIADFVFYPSVR